MLIRVRPELFFRQFLVQLLDGDVFLPLGEDIMLQEFFSTVLALILKCACFYFDAQHVQCVPVHR